MSNIDPFASLPPERSVVVPTPGARGRRPAPAGPSAPVSADPTVLAAMGRPSGLNPLVAAASALLNAVPQLRVSNMPDPTGLRTALIEGIRNFEANARAANVKPEHVIAGRYVLCTFLDEAATGTPWGSSGAWARQSLLVTFHNETWGGEKFFQLLAKLAENPQAHRDLLELLYVCLAMGFKGRYHAAGGEAQLETLRERLYVMLRQSRGDAEKELSPRWRGVALQRNALLNALPLWVSGAIAALLLLAIYIGFSLSLNAKSDPVFTAIRTIRAPMTTVAAAPQPAAAPKPVERPRLATFLAPEIAQDLVAVQDLEDRSIVTIKGDGFFKSGSNRVQEEFQPLLKRIAEALNEVPGKVLITGHTDNVPARSILGATVADPARMRSEGRADAEPIAPNDTKENMAKNRRVEVTLFVTSTESRVADPSKS
jgi:type VI secretion system protein ImpK